MPSTRKPKNVDIRFVPLNYVQRQIAASPARFKVACIGRRSGKTELAKQVAILYALMGGTVWWVAPSISLLERVWYSMAHTVKSIPSVEIKVEPRLMLFPHFNLDMQALAQSSGFHLRPVVRVPEGGSIQFRTSEDPGKLTGVGLDYLIYDEAAEGKEESWYQALAPTLTDKLGGALFISTPKGRNWFYDEWWLGHSDNLERDSEYEAFHYSSYYATTEYGGILSKEELDKRKKRLPAAFFAQEYMAEFLDDASSVFVNVKQCAVSPLQTEPDPARTYVAGIDLAKVSDYSVISIGDAEARTQVYMERTNNTEYTTQMARFLELHQRWNFKAVVVERNNIGEIVAPQLKAMGLPIVPHYTTSATKHALIDALKIAFENRDISILPDPVQINELLDFGVERTSSGLLKYGAVGRKHDDTVMALALMWSAMTVQSSAAMLLMNASGLYESGAQRAYPLWRNV